jgi:hypothetical protein
VATSPDTSSTAKDYLKRLHPSCRHAWQSYLDSEDESDIDSELASDLLEELGTLARREVMQISFEIEVDPNQAQKDEMIKVCKRYVGDNFSMKLV